MDDESTFGVLFETVYPYLRRYAHNRGLTGSDADDLVATTLEVAWQRFGEIPYAAPLPWMYAVAHNVWRNRVRAEARRGALLRRVQPPAPAPAASEPADLDASAILRALEALGPDDQELLRLIAWDQLAPSEAAVVLGCSPEVLRTRLRRARDRLAAQLGIVRAERRRRRTPVDAASAGAAHRTDEEGQIDG